MYLASARVPVLVQSSSLEGFDRRSVDYGGDQRILVFDAHTERISSDSGDGPGCQVSTGAHGCGM